MGREEKRKKTNAVKVGDCRMGKKKCKKIHVARQHRRKEGSVTQIVVRNVNIK